MKKLTLFLFSALFSLLMILGSCGKDEDLNKNVIIREQLPSTEVFVQGSLVNYGSTRADLNSDQGYGKGVWPNINVTEAWETAKFSIRIDATFPGYINQDVGDYWSKKDKVAPKNLGKVYTNYPWGRYNDRNLDYYKVDKSTGNNIGMFRYVLDPFGIKVNNALMEVPDMKEYLQWMYGLSDTKYKDKLKEILDNWDDYDLIWYVAKEVGSQYLWHVNGYFKKKDHTYTIDEILDLIDDEIDDMDISEDVEDNVEVDIHLQEHKDWNEIKTSIHVRTDAGSIKVNLPINYANIVEADDFAIRVYNYYISGIDVQSMITHDENGITINITNIDPTLIKKLKYEFGDGLTIEVHSYCKKLEGVWEELKHSTITTTKDCELKYQIGSAYLTKDDWILFPTE